MTPERDRGLAWWRTHACERLLERIHAVIAWYLPFAARRALRLDLAGVWGIRESPLPAAGAVVVANHHSWWDGYLAWLLADYHDRAFGVLVDEATLLRYPFFARLGALPTKALRAAVRRAERGSWLFVFPEGRIVPPGPPAPFEPGAATISRLASVPVLPLAWRVVVRGAQYPEVYVRSGAPLPSGATPEVQCAAVGALLERIGRDLAGATDPEAPVPEYTLWNPGRASSQERVGRWRRWWGA